MEIVRMATEADKQAFYDLWKICFGDSDAFCDWFFENRFLPAYSVCLEVEGKVVSCMQSIPLPINIRGKEVAGAMLAGVSTHPDYRKKGYMGRIFPFLLEKLREKGILAAIHTPAVLESYFPFGHYPVCGANVFTGKIEGAVTGNMVKTYNGFPVPIEGLLACYTAFAAGYSGIVARKKKDFMLKAADYFSDGGQCMVLFDKEVIEGYGFYYETQEEVRVPELVFLQERKIPVLLGHLMGFAKGKKITVKLPPEIQVEAFLGENHKIEKGVAGGLNLPKLLGILLGEEGYVIQITKDILSENIGVFDGTGRPTNQQPDLKIEGGALTQLLFGYRGIPQLVAEKKAAILTGKGTKLIGLLKTEPCFVIDEY